ncbi:hypothetical protein BaOVIS_008110 [Babesia ovis]|uniref:B-block binding subunit of TFIIIC domain-containing protein n=1 Tax=Babesia ovis TaxID=5869 RepID=A0A9W5T8Y4_BABOV|nr:hypothetical protein BaOVIS_008110 [Babesia ovis]
MSLDIYDSCLEFLASQCDPITFGNLVSSVLSENGHPELDPSTKVDLWVQLSNDKDVLVIADSSKKALYSYGKKLCSEAAALSRQTEHTDNASSRHLTNVPDEATNSDTSSVSSEHHSENEATTINTDSYVSPATSYDQSFLDFIDQSRLSPSNGLRMQKLNLLHHESILRSKDRFRILMAVASRRYNGYWQHELVSDLGISPKDIFSHMVNMSKISLVCRVSVPQDCVSRQLVMEKYQQQKRQRLGKNSSMDDDVAPVSSSQMATLWFHSRYFILDRIPEWVQDVCFNRPNEATRDRLLAILNESTNRIMLESEWKTAYCSLLLENVPGAQPNVDHRMLAKSFITFRRNLENKCKISRVFAWCPQTNRYERCIIPYSGSPGLAKLPEQVSINPNPLRVIDLTSSGHTDVSSHTTKDVPQRPTAFIYQSPHLMHGHTLSECVYYLVRCSPGGIGINELNTYLGVPYKVLAKIMSTLESKGVFVKEPFRDGKLLMYLYSVPPKHGDAPTVLTTDLNTTLDTTEDVTFSGLENAQSSNRGDTIGPLSSDGTVISEKEHSHATNTLEGNTNSDITNLDIPEHATYIEWISAQRSIFSKGACYEKRFKELFGADMKLPIAVNTPIFRCRMVLLTLYIEHFRAATCNTISMMYGDMDPSYGKKVDRKTVLRVAEIVVKHHPRIRLVRTQELKGVKISMTVLYDSHQLTPFEAFRLVNDELNRKRQFLCTHTSTLSKRINTSFKAPGETTEPEELSSMPTVGSLSGPMKLMSTTLLKGIAVTKQDISSNVKSRLSLFSQRALSNNGFIFPVMTRVKCLHHFLLNSCVPGEHYTALQLLQNMPMDLYFQVIGYGFNLRNLFDLIEGNVLPVHIEDGAIVALYENRGKRSPIFLMHRLLHILSSLGLVTVHRIPVDTSRCASIPKCVLKWEICTSVTLNSFIDPSYIVGHFELPLSYTRYWQALQTEAEAYTDSDCDKASPPTAIRELFQKKNWKRSIYIGNIFRGQLDRTISGWFRSICHGLDCRKLMKLLYMPQFLVNLICQRYDISYEHLVNYISRRIGSMSSSSACMNIAPSVMDYANDINCELEFLWLAKFVLAERLCNAIYYERLCSSTTTATDGPITWGSLRTRLLAATESSNQHVSPRHRLDVEDNPDVDIVDRSESQRLIMASPRNIVDNTSEAQSPQDDHGTDFTVVNGSNHSLDSLDSEPDISEHLDRIWCMLSMLFDGCFSPSACRYIIDCIVSKSSLSLRLIRRLRQLSSVDVIRSALRCHIPTYKFLTNKMTSVDNMKSCMKSLIFTPLVTMRPWLLDNLSELRRGRSILRQWSENGWVVRTKQTSNIYTVFKLSTYAKVKLFGKFNDIKFAANVLLSHLSLSGYNNTVSMTQQHLPNANGLQADIEKSDNYHNKRSVSQISDSLGTSHAVGPLSFSRNCDDLTMHDVYAMMDYFVSGYLSFNPVWTENISTNPPSPKRSKISHDRLNDGGISRHIRELTASTPDISSVNVGLSLPNKALSQSPRGLLCGLSNDLCSSAQLITRDIVCASTFSDALYPIGCPPTSLTEDVNDGYPLSNVEYTSDANHNWWSSQQYISAPLSSSKSNYRSDQEIMSDEISEEMLQNAFSSITENDDHKSSANKYSYVTAVVTRALNLQFGSLCPELGSLIPEMESHVYDLILMVKESGINGLTESRLYSRFREYLGNKLQGMVGPSLENTSISRAMFDVALLTAQALRFITRVAANEEYVYYYWDHQPLSYVKPEPIVGVRPYVKSPGSASRRTEYTLSRRPEYIPPSFWFLYESFDDFTSYNGSSDMDLGHLSSLFQGEDDRSRYEQHRHKSPLCSFVSLDGHLNRCLLAFVMLRIALLLKTIPGQTAEEVWEKLVLLDLCEVKSILDGMISLGICRQKLLDLSLPAESCSGVDKAPSLVIYFALEDSSWLPKFRSVLLPYYNSEI